MMWLLLVVLLAFDLSNGTVELTRTEPSAGAPVCPLETITFICMANNELLWTDLRVGGSVGYTISRDVGAVEITGNLTLVLTNKTGTRLTSTATVDSVLLEYEGRMIRCREINGSNVFAKNITINVAGPPSAPTNLMAMSLNETSDGVSVQLSWSPPTNSSSCVHNYTLQLINTLNDTTDTSTVEENMTTATLTPGGHYSFRVRSVDAVGRGEWSNIINYNVKNSTHLFHTSLQSTFPVMIATNIPPSDNISPTSFSDAEIAGITTGSIIFFVFIIIAIAITAAWIFNWFFGKGCCSTIVDEVPVQMGTIQMRTIVLDNETYTLSSIIGRNNNIVSYNTTHLPAKRQGKQNLPIMLYTI